MTYQHSASEPSKPSQIRAVGVIPSRWSSTRFPGKSLALIAGKPLVQRVVERTRLAQSLQEVIVATDDDRIREAAVAMGVRVVMTRSDHPSGTDRIAEAMGELEADIVVNIQGDEPLIDPELIDQLVEGLASDSSWDMATAAVPITDEAEKNDPSVVKVVWAEDGQALYFSRSVIPHLRDEKDGVLDGGQVLYWRHIGIYVYRREFLDKMVKTSPCLLENAEKLEQLRALHLGARMKVVQAEQVGPGVDTPEDVAKVEALIRQQGLS